MTDLTQHPLPRVGQGVVTWPDLSRWMHTVLREIAARQDVRNPLNDFAAALVADDTGVVTVGNDAIPLDRDVGVPTLVQKIDDVGRAADQRFLYPVTVSNRNSVQNISDVLVATSDETGSEIEVNAHSVRYDFGDVAYASGTVSGLEAETQYYCYCDDPDLEGGAVTYYATTNPDNLIAKGRYYLGYVWTPVTSSAQTITAATSANPIELTTSAAHGWANGNSVELSDLPGDFGTNLNGNSYVITVTAANKLTIPVDGSLYAAYTTGGTAQRVSGASESGGGAGAGVGGNRFDLTVIP